MAFPDAWPEFCLIGLVRQGGSEVQFAPIIDSIEINEGDYPGESVPTVSGGRIWKQSPQEDGEITFEAYPIELDTTSAVGFFQQYVGVSGAAGSAYDTTEPLITDTSWPAGVAQIRDRWRVIVLWSNDPAVATAGAATATSTDSLRFIADNCRMISHQLTFKSDELLKVTLTFKFPARIKSGATKNYAWESGDQTALVAVATTFSTFS